MWQELTKGSKRDVRVDAMSETNDTERVDQVPVDSLIIGHLMTIGVSILV
jgi:hypothetical protein